MRKIIVELDDWEMAQVDALARARQVAVADVLKTEALKASQHVAPLSSDEAQEQRRQARLAVLMRSHGIFAGDQDKPKDGLAYQRELRAEWQ